MRHAIQLLILLCAFVVCARLPTHGCTIFVAARDGIVLAGNNEDNAVTFNPDTRIWFLPPEHDRYGIMFLGYADGIPQGGMNDHGLFFDGATLPTGAQLLLGDRNGKTAILEFTPEKHSAAPKGEGNQLLDTMMSHCATVEEALGVLTPWLDQLGARYHVLRGAGDYQVATNFQQSITPPGKITCKRYQAATKMLSERSPLSVDLFRSILQATHQVGQEGPVTTFYSNICDLKNGVIYLYYRGDFDKVVELHLAEELKKGRHELRFSECFK